MRPSIIAAVAALGACGAPPSTPAPRPAAPFDVTTDDGDVEVATRVTAHATSGVTLVEAFFGDPFPRRFDVLVFSDRARLDQHWGAMWHEPGLATECWMIGMGMAGELSILSPARWRDQACEHDPDDDEALGRFIAHELVHTYHQQLNATIADDSAAAEAIGWFVEGVATYASGQLDDGKRAPAIEAIRTGAAPVKLADAWSGKYRYGVSGSLVAYLDATAGRPALRRMLEARTPGELLAVAGLDEATLLER